MSCAAGKTHRGTRSILTLAGLSGLLYAVVHVTQESMFDSGPNVVGEPGLWGDPASHPRLIMLLVVFTGAIVGLLALYARLVALSRRGTWSPRAWWLAICLPMLFYAGFLTSRPYFSTDLYSYAAFGYIGTLPGGNVYSQEANTVRETPFGQQLRALGWGGAGLSAYGPLWNDLEAVMVRLTPDAFLAVVLGKALVGGAIIGSAGLVFSILEKVHPQEQQTGTLAVLWNPLFVLLLAGDGHNDACILVLVLAGLAMSVRRQVAAGVLMQLLGTLAKYLPMVLLPVQVAFWWRTETDRPRLLLRLGLGGLIGLGLAMLLYAPVWLGAGTFMGTGVLGTGASGGSSFSLPSGPELYARYAVVLAALLVGAWRARDAQSLLSSCAGVLLVVILVGPQKFWPWYATAPIALMALTPSLTFRWTILVLTGSSLLASPIEALPLSPHSLFNPMTQSLAFHMTRVLPILTLVALSIRGALSARGRTSATL